MKLTVFYTQTATRRAADRRARRAAAAAAPSNSDAAEAGPSDGNAAPAAPASSESSGAEVISPAQKAESPAALPVGDDFADLSQERRQEIQVRKSPLQASQLDLEWRRVFSLSDCSRCMRDPAAVSQLVNGQAAPQPFCLADAPDTS